jgi:small-conductance mechanosensitive channel
MKRIMGLVVSRWLLVVVCLLAAPGAGAQTTPGAGAQTTLTVHHPAASPTGVVTPPKATASAIIPGSPLAALTGAAPPPGSRVTTPYGASSFGLALTDVIGNDVKRTLSEGVSAVQRSTDLAPVARWLVGLPSDRDALARGFEAVVALAIAFVPAVAVEQLLRVALAGVIARLAARAAGSRPAGASEDELVNDEPSEPDPVPDETAVAPAAGDETFDDHALRAAAARAQLHRRDTLVAVLRRLLNGLAHLVLLVLPLVGFALTIQVLILVGILTSRPGHLAVIGIGNAYLVVRGVMVFMTLLVAPRAPALRLVPVSTGGATHAWRASIIVLSTVFIGYTLVSLSEILGLDHTGAMVVGRIIALIAHLEVAFAIWRGRHAVARWIAGRPDAPGTVAALRRSLAGVWHIFALFYVLALWIAYAAGVHNAFSVLLRVVLVVIGGGVFGRLAWMACSALLDRALPDPTASPARHARARAYNPLVRLLIRILIGALVLLCILQGWGVDAFGYLASNKLSRSLLATLLFILITIAIALTFWEWVNALCSGWIDRLAATGRSRQASRLRTLMPLFKTAIAVVLVLTCGIICLTRLGVNATPLLAISSVVGIAVGFGSQKLVQDIITGLFLLLEDAMQVGDKVTLASMTGTVERLSIRTIRLRGNDGSMNIIPFSSVTTVTNLTRDFGVAQLSIAVAYDEDLDHVYAVMNEIAAAMQAEPRWGAVIRDDLQIFGLDEFGASALVITAQIRTGPGQQWAVRREFYQRVKKRFGAEGIEMPYTYLAPGPAREGQKAIEQEKQE